MAGMTEPEIKLTLGQRIVLAVMGRVFLYNWKHPGWAHPMSFYAFKCRDHGLVVAPPQGYGAILICPECSKCTGSQ